MTTIEQQNQSVGTQYNFGHIGEAHLNLPPQIADALLEIFKKDEAEDLTVAQLTLRKFEPETIFIPQGSFLMGSKPGEGIPEFEMPEFRHHLPAYRMGKYPVTNAQFAYYLEKRKQYAWPQLGWENGNEPKEFQFNMPVRGLSWYEALAYCYWLIEETGRPYSLPSEAQWEKAARGPDGKIFPWGNEWQDGRNCNTDSGVVTPVDEFDDGASEYGCLDMVGNVREWTTSLWGRNRHYHLEHLSPYPLSNEKKFLANLKENKQIRRVTRGGASLAPEMPLRAARRQSELPYHCGITNNRLGFRVAMNLGGEL